jgi:hypothetical protein
MTQKEKLDLYMEKIIDALKAEHQFLKGDLELVFTKVTEVERRYLAIWGYLRFPLLKRGTLESNWPQKDSAIDPDVDRAIDKVIQKWVAPDRTYRLDTKKEIRTLSDQIDLWKKNSTSVKPLGSELLSKLLKQIETYDETPADDSVKKLRTYIEKLDLSGSPTNATPGLSMHGTGRAFDFIVYKSGTPIAGTSTTKESLAVWDGPENWTQRLKDAAEAANKDLTTGKWDGPLKLSQTYEPWHYIFIKSK